MDENAGKSGVSKRIAALRGLAGVSARSLSRLAGLAQGHVGLIESGRMGRVRGLEEPTLAKLSRTLGCSVEYLRDGDGEAPQIATIKRAITRARKRREAERKTSTPAETVAA